jgi:predicted nucleic-acid-binding Zn-ribbon protein
MPRPKKTQWKCLECGAEGEASDRIEASGEFSRHWIATHQEVNF